jgi:hypothetical protein
MNVDASPCFKLVVNWKSTPIRGLGKVYRIFAMKVCSYPFLSGMEKSERERKEILR